MVSKKKNNFYFKSKNGHWYLYVEGDSETEYTVLSCGRPYYVENFLSEEELLIRANLMGICPKKTDRRDLNYESGEGGG